MADETKVCESCGQKIRKLNPHRMDSQKVRVLEDIAKLNLAGHSWVLATEGYDLKTVDVTPVVRKTAYRARAHASRLVWFGLLDHEGTRTGHYRVNPNGLQFLAGLRAVPQTILCKDGVVIERSQEETRISDVKKVILDKAYWDEYWKRQKHPEAGGQKFLFD